MSGQTITPSAPVRPRRLARDVWPFGHAAILASTLLFAACGGSRLGPAVLGHTLVDRSPNPTPAWVEYGGYVPTRIEAEDSLVFLGRSREGGYLTGKLAALSEADIELARTISTLVLQCGRMRGLAPGEAEWTFAARVISTAVQSGVAPPAEYFEEWRRDNGTTYYRWWTRSVVRGRDVREGMRRSADQLLAADVSAEVRAQVRRCLDEGLVP